LGEVFRGHVLGIGVCTEGKGDNPILFEKKSSVFGVIPAAEMCIEIFTKVWEVT
jgi:hypothetical protein